MGLGKRRGALVAAGGLLDAALCGKRGKRLTDMGRAHAAGVPELRERERPIGVRQDVLKLVDRRGRRWWREWGRRVDDLQGERVVLPTLVSVSTLLDGAAVTENDGRAA